MSKIVLLMNGYNATAATAAAAALKFLSRVEYMFILVYAILNF